MNAIDKLSQLFLKFPGVGKRQAKRFVYFLLRSNPSYVRELMREIQTLTDAMQLCTTSYQYFVRDASDDTRSPIERDPRRTQSELMIVYKDMDLENIERTGVYQGRYFVLGGLIPIAKEDDYGFARVHELIGQINDRGESLEEVIFALPVNPEGDHTRIFLATKIQPLAEQYGFNISTLGRGLSTGTELEYIDEDTMQNAFGNRH